MTETQSAEETVYRLGKKTNLWMILTSSGTDLNPTWQLQLTSRNRGGSKVLAILWETTALKPIGAVTIKGETYPLTIGWHAMKRGGILCVGGERKTGADLKVAWEMRCQPSDEVADCFECEIRLRSDPRRIGRVGLHIFTPLYRPEVVSLPSAAARGHCAITAWSAYHKHSAGFVMLTGVDDEVGWEESKGGFAVGYNDFPFGGGRAIRFTLQFRPSDSVVDARQTLTDHYATVADSSLHPAPILRPILPVDALARYADPSAYRSIGVERLYPLPPDVTASSTSAFSGEDRDEVFYAGHPHYPLEMLSALWDWQRLQPHPDIPRLVRFGASGIATDFQVMGREGQPEPNKGAFWDRLKEGRFSDFAGGLSHGIAANARIARSLFLINQATGEALFKQTAINICQWLILKHNDLGYYSGERAHATRGLPDDGKVYGDPCSIDGVASIRCFVLAYKATANEVYIKAARKIAEYLGEDWMAEHEPVSPVAAANVILALLAFDAESANERRRSVIREWAAWMRLRPLNAESPSANYDGHYGGVFDCAQAALRFHTLESDPDYLRYAFSAISAIPEAVHRASWRSIRLYINIMLSIVSVLPDATTDFDAMKVRIGWRDFSTDQATAGYMKVAAGDGTHVESMTLVCRGNDQVLLIVLAPPHIREISILKNGKTPLAKDLFTDNVDIIAQLHPLIGEDWARVGLFTIDP